MKPFQAILPSLAVMVFTIASCKKEIETQIQIKEVEKKSSWSEVPIFYGLERVILSTGSTGNSIYLQQPNLFTKFINQNPVRGRRAAINPVSDVRVRLAIGAQIHAYPDSDSVLAICRNDEPLNYRQYVQLKQLDPTAVRLDTRLFPLSKCMAINENNYVLAPYDNNRQGRPFTFLLSAVVPGAPGMPVTASTRLVVIPKSAFTSGYVRNLAAIDDYFLVNLGDAGIYKIKQDGTFRRVYSYALVDAFYKWNNTVYAPVEYNEILTSTDNGDTWQKSTGTPDHFTLANYYPVGDSLVGVYQSNLFSLRWNGPRFTSRFLKNDGLERARITGIETLRDTVYVATTSGLFARPFKSFFETKQ